MPNSVEQLAVEVKKIQSGTGSRVTNSTNVVTLVSREPETPEYDLEDNLTKDGRWVYSWTPENRLRRMETRTDLPAAVPRINLEFKYDH